MREQLRPCMDCGDLCRSASGYCEACFNDAALLDIERERDDFVGGDAA